VTRKFGVFCAFFSRFNEVRFGSDIATAFWTSRLFPRPRCSTFHQVLLLKPTVDYHCSIAETDDISDTCLHLTTFLRASRLLHHWPNAGGRPFPVSIASGCHLLSLFSYHEDWRPSKFATAFMPLPQLGLLAIYLFGRTHSPWEDVQACSTSWAHRVELTAVSCWVCDCMLGVLAQYVVVHYSS
jgi:hypothetical protein